MDKINVLQIWWSATETEIELATMRRQDGRYNDAIYDIVWWYI
jgi:hypothetical protein